MPKFFLHSRKDRPPTVAKIYISVNTVKQANLLNPDGSGVECTVEAVKDGILIKRKEDGINGNGEH